MIDKDTRTLVTSHYNKAISQLKLGMMTIYISTAKATARGHAEIAKEDEKMKVFWILAIILDDDCPIT
jgi:hypothetical protein